MESSTRTYWQAGSASAVAIGSVLIGWGLLSVASPAWHAVTIAPLDTLLATISRHVWVPALGLSLVLAGLVRNLHGWARQSDLWEAVSLVSGVLLFGLGVSFPIVALNTLAGAVYSAPLTLSGLGLLAVATHARKET